VLAFFNVGKIGGFFFLCVETVKENRREKESGYFFLCWAEKKVGKKENPLAYAISTVPVIAARSY